MKGVRERFHHDWNFILIATATALGGLNFIINPNLLEDKSTYAFIVNLLDDLAFSIPMFIFGFVGMVLFLFGKKQYRTRFLVSYQFFWMTLFLAYLWRAFSGFPNTSWILALVLNAAIFLSALWGDEYAR